jgi:hypothetical protein
VPRRAWCGRSGGQLGFDLAERTALGLGHEARDEREDRAQTPANPRGSGPARSRRRAARTRADEEAHDVARSARRARRRAPRCTRYSTARTRSTYRTLRIDLDRGRPTTRSCRISSAHLQDDKRRSTGQFRASARNASRPRSTRSSPPSSVLAVVPRPARPRRKWPLATFPADQLRTWERVSTSTHWVANTRPCGLPVRGTRSAVSRACVRVTPSLLACPSRMSA